jgi:Predicted small integral membrane protein
MNKATKTAQVQHRTPAFYAKLAKVTEHAVGHPAAFGLATTFVLGWGVFGPIYFTTTWHAILHTMTASITFLMVFLIQNSESRGSAAIQLKLDELLRTSTGARNALLNIEDLTLDDLEKVREHYKKLSSHARAREKRGLSDTGTPDVSL